MHRFYLALSAHSSAWGSLSDLRGKLNYKAGGGKGGGMPFVTTQCCGNASLLFWFFFNKWATVTESRLLSVFLSYRKKNSKAEKKKKERVKKTQIEKDWELNKDVLSKLHFWHRQSETQFQQSCVTATSFRLWAILSGLYFQSFHALLSDETTVKPWLPTLSKSVIV